MPRKHGGGRNRGSRSRGWCVTVNDYKPEDEKKLQAIVCDYIVYGREKAPSTGMPHLQVYLYFGNPREFGAVQAMLPRGAHIEKANGSPQANRVYCTKDGDIYEHGVCPRQGKRTDFTDMRDMALQGIAYSKILDCCTSLVGVRGVEALMKYDHKDLNVKKQVQAIWFWGPTGTGKTTQCRLWIEEHGFNDDFWQNSKSLDWFDGYIDQKVALLDDLRLDMKDYGFFLSLFDGWKKRVPTKGGHTWWYPDYILITCPWHPKDFAPPREDPKQLTRRLEKIIHLKKKVVEGVEDNPIHEPIEEELEI